MLNLVHETHGDGPVVALIHGAGSDRRQFAPLVPLLADRFTTLTYDQRDIGESDAATEPYAMTAHADDLAELLDRLGHRRAHVCGFSYGAAIAVEFALRHPGRLDRLVLCTPHEGRGGMAPAPAFAEAMLAVARQEQGASLRLAKLFFSPDRTPDELANLLGSLEGCRGRQSDAQRTRRTDAVADYTTVGRLSELPAETLVLGGFKDQVFPPEGCWRVAAALPDATLIMLPDAGHAMTLEAPSAAATAICGFLTRDAR